MTKAKALERVLRLWDKHPYDLTLSNYYELRKLFAFLEEDANPSLKCSCGIDRYDYKCKVHGERA